MTLSLRNVVHTRYGLAGSFSIRNDVLSRLPHDVNCRTADGKVSLRLILTPPIAPFIASFTTSREKVPENDKVTLAWDVRLPTAWLSKNTFVELNHAGVGLSGQKDFTPHFPSTTYELVAYVRVPGGRADASKKIVVNVDRPTPQGPSKLLFFNCSSERHTLHFWVRDYTASTGWVEKGSLSPQYDQWGTCPGGGATPFVISLEDRHDCEIVAVDPDGYTCGGHNDPTIVGCRKWAVRVTGSKSGPTPPPIIIS